MIKYWREYIINWAGSSNLFFLCGSRIALGSPFLHMDSPPNFFYGVVV